MASYDVAQICGNGHKITTMYESSPEFRQKFCDDCGAETITQCSQCETKIRGYCHIEGVIGRFDYTVPSYCHECGKPYPWTSARSSAIEELVDLAPGLSVEEKAIIKESLPDIAKSTPRSEVAALKIKKVLSKSKEFGKKVMEKIVTDLATDQTKILLLAAKDTIF